MRVKVGFLIIMLGAFLFSENAKAVFYRVGYLPAWNGYPTSINNVDLTRVTHINIAFGNPDAAGDLTGIGTTANIATVVNAAHAQGVKVLVSIGGAGAPGSRYSSLITTDLSGFVSKLVQFTVDNNLDGIDVDIEGDVLNGSTMTSTQYQNFIVALEAGLHAQSKLMTAALATWFASRVSNIAASKFDFINIMSYDAYGTWTGPGQHSSYDMAVSDLNYWITTKAVPASKLTVGVPFYGYYWGTGNYSYTFSLITSNYPGSENKDKFIPSNGGIIYYNGIPTIKQKTAMALENAAGIMFWELTQDATGSKSLLKAIDDVVDGYATNVDPTVSVTAPLASTVYEEGDTVTIDLNAADVDGNIIKVSYYADSYLIGEQYSGPFSFEWIGAASGTYNIKAVVVDNMGTSVTSSNVSITVNAASASLPFTGTPIAIPGRLELENYNLGNNNVAYYDNSTTNEGNAYRNGRVDIEECLDAGGGYDVGWTNAGEWLEYTVDIAATKKYDFQCRVASGSSGSFYIMVNGSDVTGQIDVANTGGWQKWQTITQKTTVKLQQGVKKLRIMMNGGINMNYIQIVDPTATGIEDEVSFEEATRISPNPLSESSRLHFYLDHPGKTKVALFDEMGRQVLVISNDYRASGENELLIDKGSLPKGIYLCKISSDQEEKIIKLVVE